VIGDEPGRTSTTPGVAPGPPAPRRRPRAQRPSRQPAPARPPIPTGTRPRRRREPATDASTWLDTLRRIAAVVAVLVAVVLIETSVANVCADVVTGGGQVVRTCRAPQATDGVVIGWALFILLH
jgi:hypothetical protein